MIIASLNKSNQITKLKIMKKNNNNPKQQMKIENRVLVIGDIHEPFCLKGYREFCLKVRDEFSCNRIVFIGDIIDNHYTSYHEEDPDGYGGGDELDLAISKVKEWDESFKGFPIDVIIGNHDRLITRKAFSGKIPSKWIKDYNEVLGIDWNWHHRLVIDNVQYLHGEGGTARTVARNEMMSTVSGHRHTQCYTEWLNNNVFACQVGSGIDKNSYAMAYAKYGKAPMIGCSVIIDGKIAVNRIMD